MKKPMTKNRYARLSSFRLCKTLLLFACLSLGPALGWCSSAKTHVDKGPVKARTFSFLDTGTRQPPNYAEAVKQAHAMIQQGLIHNLAAKGIGYAPTGGDVTVAYLIIIGNNAATTSLNDYFGYNDDSDALVEKVHKKQTGSNDNRGYFEAGTLVIDILNPKTSKVLQRRSVEAQILKDLPAEQRSARLQKLVDQAMENVPIAPR
jgi:hypothetical protein